MSSRCLALGAVLLTLATIPVLPAVADEIWIAPSESGNVATGDWGVTSTGDAHFAFAVPDSLDHLTGAQVMVIGKQDRSITYDLHLSISHDGQPKDAFSADSTELPATVDSDELTALDASALFPALVAGQDVVALHFQASPQGSLRVVGLRFQFARVPDQAGISCPAGQFLVGFADVTGAPVCKSLAEVTGGGGGQQALLEIDNVELAEGNAGTTAFVFTVSLSEPTGVPVTVDFSTLDGTAQAGSDYVAASGSLTFAPGEVTKQITVAVNGDTAVEDVEVFFVELSNASGAGIGDPEGVGRILNDDNAGGPGDGRE